MRPLFIALIILAACQPEEGEVFPEAYGPRVTFEYTAQDFTFDALYVELGMTAWRRACFDVRLPSDPGGTSGDIHIVIAAAPYLGEGVSGKADRESNIIVVRSDLETFRIASVVAHEAGHVLLNTHKHLDGWGVMRTPSYGWELLEDDLDFACEEAGFCDRCQ